MRGRNTTDRRTGTASGERRDTGRWRPGRLVAEFGIIFVGVFGAFVAEDLRQQREDGQRARQTYAAILGEVQAFQEHAPVVASQMRGAVESWERARDEGMFPPPPFYREPRAETPAVAIWEATLASGGVALLDPDLFNELAVFYNRVISASDRYRRYNERTERDVLPFLSESSHFYDADGRLRGAHRAHVDLLAELWQEIDALAIEAEAVEERILEALDD